MAVPAGPTEKRYVGNGVSTIFTVPFLVIQASDLAVYIDGVKLTSGYSQSGVGNPESSVTFATPPAVNAQILLALEVPFERLNDYQENGDFLADTVNNDFDRIWQALKQLLRYAGRDLTLGQFDIDGQGWYRAKGNGIRGLRDPILDQDAATLSWTSEFVGNLLSAIQGPINNAANIFYQGPDGSANVVQDMSKPDGAVLIGGAGVIVPSVYDLTQILNPKDGRSYSTQGYRQGSTKGGGHFVWRANASKALHDGVSIIDPGRPFPTDFNNTGQVSSWLTAVTGTGVFVKVWSPVRGAYEAGISDTASASDRLMLTALLNSLAAQGGRLAIMPFQLSTVLPFTVEIPRTISLDLNDSTIEFQLTGALRAFSMNSRTQLYNGTVNVNGTSPIGGGDNHAPVSGGNQTTGVGISKTKVFDLTISTNRTNGNGIVFFGECTGIEIDNITAPNSSTMGRTVALEWGGSASGSGHPHNCKISNINAGTMSFGGGLGDGAFVVWLSSTFNIDVENVYADSTYGMLGVFPGDLSSDYAPLRYRNQLGTGITARNISCNNIKQYGIRVYGKGTSSSTLLPQSVTIINPTLRSDGLTTAALGIVAEFCDNVVIINPDISAMQIGITTGQDTRNLSIKGGKVWGNRASGISLGNPGGNVTRIEIDGVRLYGNNTAGFSGVGGAAAIFIQNCSDWTVKNCWFGLGAGETQQYSVRIETTAPGGMLKGNRTLGLIAGGVAYVNSSSTDYALGTIGEDNTAAPGITVFGGAPIYFIKGNGLKFFIMAGAAAPTTGTWVRGDTCEFALPSAGGNKGAVCTTGGAGGAAVWKTFGGIAA